MKIKEEYSLTYDNQFYLWKVSSISNWKKRNLEGSIFQKKEPLNITDAEALMDDLLFPHKTSIIRVTATFSKLYLHIKLTCFFFQLRTIQLSLKQTRILTTLLPDEIINIPDLKSNTLDSYVGVLLFADVSGMFTLFKFFHL